MKKIALIYGGIAGAITIATMILGYAMAHGNKEGFFASQAFGYLTMLVALSMIFMGIKRYRDIELGGVVKFVPALLLGLGIAAIAAVAYVIGWEVYLNLTDYAFINDYTAHIIEAKKSGWGERRGVGSRSGKNGRDESQLWQAALSRTDDFFGDFSRRVDCCAYFSGDFA